MSTKTLYISGSTYRIEIILSALESPNVGLSNAHKLFNQNPIASSVRSVFSMERDPFWQKVHFQ